jgi:hypothetical protein
MEEAMYVTRYQWVLTYWGGYQLQPVTVWVPMYYTPFMSYYTPVWQYPR